MIRAARNMRTGQTRSDINGVSQAGASEFQHRFPRCFSLAVIGHALAILRSRRVGLSCLPCSIPCHLSQVACHRA
jgi:hypothetical protein